MIEVCVKCQWADVTYGDQYCCVFCQGKSREIYDISQTCKRYEPKTEDEK